MADKKILGFIGTGVMGVGMAGHLLAAGNEVHVFNRTKSKAEPLLAKGAVWEDSPVEIAKKCDVIFTIIGFPKDVEATYLGDKGLIANAKKDAILVDMTTSSPKLAQKIWQEGHKKGVKVLDAPVTGGDKGARAGTLTILVGGEEEDYNTVLPYFETMGKNINYMGKAGAGQNTKLVNQTMLAGTMIGMCEGLAFAKAVGLDQKKVFDALATGAAGSASLMNYAPRLFNNDFEPGFYIKHYIKDMKLAAEAANDCELDVPGLDLALELYEELADAGLEEKGTQTLYALYDPGVIDEE
ncbi:NAD(P)-dependent oxidoreductase [Synergistaceae bacterium OttesenSCG-928-D05]|nr:NAD(P)-dependent oxidoreductase [Synergistaceae bacterium OttesenSCG-928-D05]